MYNENITNSHLHKYMYCTTRRKTADLPLTIKINNFTICNGRQQAGWQIGSDRQNCRSLRKSCLILNKNESSYTNIKNQKFFFSKVKLCFNSKDQNPQSCWLLNLLNDKKTSILRNLIFQN